MVLFYVSLPIFIFNIGEDSDSSDDEDDKPGKLEPKTKGGDIADAKSGEKKEEKDSDDDE